MKTTTRIATIALTGLLLSLPERLVAAGPPLYDGFETYPVGMSINGTNGWGASLNTVVVTNTAWYPELGTNAVVMPPSVHWLTGLPYRFQTPFFDIAVAPSWLCDLVARPEPPGILSRPVRRMSPGQARRRGRGLVDVVANAAAGQRHIALYWAARRAAEEGLLDVEGYLDIALTDAARDAGLAPDEIERTVTDAVMAARAGGGC